MVLRLTSNALTSGRFLDEGDITLTSTRPGVRHFWPSPTPPFVISYLFISSLFHFFPSFFLFSSFCLFLFPFPFLVSGWVPLDHGQ